MTGRASLRLLALVILSGVSACDNVEWGGARVHLQEPPPARVGAQPDTVPSEEERFGEVPDGPVLFMAERDGEGLRLIPVGAILEDSVGYFPSEREASGYRARFARQLMPQGAEFVLFAGGVRVGTFTVGAVETDESFCVPRPAARGVVELIPEAMGLNRFLALPREHGETRERLELAVAELDREQRDATLSLPAQVLARLGVPERPANILNIRFDMQAFHPGGHEPTLFTATYLVRDRLQVERPPPTAWSLFILGAPGGNGYEATFAWYRHVSERGKGAPRFFEQMDWDGDGRAEVLLEVLGERHRWFAALDQAGGAWRLSFEEPCGATAPPIGASG